MAATTEDDEAWLYTDAKPKTENKSPTPESQSTQESAPGDEEITIISDKEAEAKKKEDREAGELSGEEEPQEDNQENQEKDDDEDSDDDNVQVTIGDIKQWTDQPRNLFKGAGGYQKAAPTGKQQKGVDIDAVGTTEDGVPIFEFDLDSIQTEDKPWRKPGADITDYFNYGFNEETWKQYCDKQKKLRIENQGSAGAKAFITHNITPNKTTLSTDKKDLSSSSPQSVQTLLQRKAHPPPNRKMGGTIDVIGSTARDSRRPNQPQNEVQVQHITVADSGRGPNFGGPVVLTSTVPPSMPPHMVPPPDFAVPPPTVPHGVPTGIPPPGLPIIAPGFPPPEAYDAYYHPPPTTGPPPDGRSSYDGRSGYSYGGGPQYGGAPIYSSASGPPNWNSRSGDYRGGWDYGGMSQMDSDSDFSSSGSELDYRYRDRRSRYDREREYNRYRERDRESYKDRPRSADRDKERRHKDDKHRSRRKHKDDEDSDAHKSKHKKSKRSKRDRDDETSVAGEESVKGD